MKKEQKKALTRTLNKILKKHRINNAGLKYIWEPFMEGKGATIGNLVSIEKPTNRQKRRLKGCLPELLNKLNRTSKACKWIKGFNFEVIDKLIQ